MIRNSIERYGYTAKIDGFHKSRLVLTIRDPKGKKVKQASYKNYASAIQGWYHFCSANKLLIRPNKKPAIIPEEAQQIEIPAAEEPAQIVKVIGDTMPITAIVDFNFTNELNLSLPEWIEDINDRIKRVEFLPSDIARIRLVPNT